MIISHFSESIELHRLITPCFAESQSAFGLGSNSITHSTDRSTAQLQPATLSELKPYSVLCRRAVQQRRSHATGRLVHVPAAGCAASDCNGVWMALRYKRPAHIEDAQVFVGSKIKVHWEENVELSFPEGWYDATVSQVHRISEEGPNKLFFGIK